ncbi:MAG: erythromycin esterase family protein [Anaerolineae bacterium]
MARLGFWTWNADEVLDLVEWMHAHNQGRGDAPPVGFFGFDIRAPGLAMDNITGHLARVDPDAVSWAGSLFSCIRPYRAPTQAYAELPETARRQCRPT